MVFIKLKLLALGALLCAAVSASPAAPPSAAVNNEVLDPEVTDVSETLLSVLKRVPGQIHIWDNGKINHVCKQMLGLNNVSDIEMFDARYDDMCIPKRHLFSSNVK
jgi:hypothetical protein